MPSLFVATGGAGLYRSDDLGSSWTRDSGVPASARLRSLWSGAGQLLVGGEGRVFRRSEGQWRELALPSAAAEVWAACALEGVLLAGTDPVGLWRSDDAGATWEHVRFSPAGAPAVPPSARITHLLPNPNVTGEVWAAVEVGGVFATGDGGRVWSAANDGIPSLDVHALAWCSGAVLVAAMPTGIATWRSARWFAGVFGPGDRYCHSLASRRDAPGTLYCAFGDGPNGSRGGVAVSTDGARSWQACPFPDTVGGAISSVAAAAEPPGLVVACSLSGKVFVSPDGGEGWTLALDCGAPARAVACTVD